MKDVFVFNPLARAPLDNHLYNNNTDRFVNAFKPAIVTLITNEFTDTALNFNSKGV